MPDTKSIGNAGEEKASQFLFSINYQILERNWRTKRGEVDIIALDGDILVFVEVKTVPNSNQEMLSWVLDKRKQKRIIETAKCFLSEYRQYNEHFVRFDVLVVDMCDQEPVYHIKDAFSEIL